MKIAVCIKLVPSSEGQITIKDPATGVAEDDVKIGLNAYDEVALEQAVQLKEAGVASEVIAFSASHRSNMKSTLQNALAKGADKLVYIEDSALADADAISVAYILAKEIQAAEVGMVFCGMMATDTNGGQLPAMLAEVLGWAHVSEIASLETDGSKFKAWKEIGAKGSVRKKALISGSGPVVFSCDKTLQEPRKPKLKERRDAKKKPFEQKSLSDVGYEIEAAQVVDSNWVLPAKKSDCKFIEGDTQTAVQELVRLLREEAKVL